MNIEFSDKEREFLKQFALKQCENAVDNVGTMTPIHVVERQDKVFVAEGNEVWILNDDCDFTEFDSFDDLVKHLIENDEDNGIQPYDEVKYENVNDVFIYDEQSYFKAYEINAYSGRYVVSYRPVAFFFILDEAKRYKNEYQSHNCGDCRIYTYGLGYSNCGDLPIFRELLMRIGKQLLK